MKITLDGKVLFRGGGCRGNLSEERPGLPCAGHSWFQLAPMGTPQGTAESPCQDSSVCGKVYLRNSKKHCAENIRERSKGSVKNSPADTKVREERGGDGAPGNLHQRLL